MDINSADLIQYGGVGLAFLLSIILYKVFQMFYKLVTNHEQHFIEITKQHTIATLENTKVLAELKDVILLLKK